MSRVKKFGALLGAVVLLLIIGFTAHKVYAGKPVISLNSPVSFPVDI
ncbi:hypothetical protein [Methylophaga sp. OBS1]|nr:hypothetical protein [Methylophaga sp. OBS1]MCX4192321.1 hypothetical protein [Methylophaga sp. OBS1]